MIRFTRAYVDGAGKTYATLEEAQLAELLTILYHDPQAENSEVAKGFAGAILAHKQEILDVLTMTDASRPGARGKAKPRKNKPAASQEVAA